MKRTKVCAAILCFVFVCSFTVTASASERNTSLSTDQLYELISTYVECPVTDHITLSDGPEITEQSDSDFHASLYTTTAANGEILRYEFYDRTAEQIYTLTGNEVLSLSSDSQKSSSKAIIKPAVFDVESEEETDLFALTIMPIPVKLP